MKIKKGDTVVIISGKDRNKKGKVLSVFPKINKILVEGVAFKKRHLRPRKTGQKGEIVTTPTRIDASSAMLFCSHCGKGVRVGHAISESDKIRICKKCKNKI